MDKLYLLKRATASLLDKLMIVIIIIIINLFIMLFWIMISPKEKKTMYAEESGTYCAWLFLSPHKIDRLTEIHIMKEHGISVLECNYIERERFRDSHIDEYVNYKKHIFMLDIIFTLFFAIINSAYFFICEITLRASLWKHIFGFTIIDKRQHPIDISTAVSRAVLLIVLICLVLIFRWHYGGNYLVLSFIFFLILDIPIFFTQRSLLDIISGVKLICLPGIRKNHKNLL